jgi:tetratricopeptide (TPR) repeat protein
MTSIYNLSWGETSFLAKLQLFFKSRKQEKEKMHSSDARVQAGGLSALSSTYYSIVGTAFSQLKVALRPKLLAPVKVAVWCFTWLPLAAWCYWRMLPLSNRIVELIGYDGMSADQCDVRQSVLRRRGQYDEAMRCIRAALAKNPEKAHTRGLLHVGLAEIYHYKGDRQSAQEETHAALAEVAEAEKQDSRQAVRIYRHCADLFSQIGGNDRHATDDLRRKAQELAQATSTRDQLLKL